MLNIFAETRFDCSKRTASEAIPSNDTVALHAIPLRSRPLQECTRNPVETLRAEKRYEVFVRQQTTKAVIQPRQHSLYLLQVSNQRALNPRVFLISPCQRAGGFLVAAAAHLLFLIQ